MGTKLGEEIRQEVIKLYYAGYARDEIAAEVGVATGSVSNIIDEFADEVGREEVEASHQFFVHCRKSDITSAQAITGARIYILAEMIGLDLPNLESYLKQVHEECENKGITPAKLVEICRDLIDVKQSTDIPLQELATYHHDLVNHTKTLSSESDRLEQETKKEKEELSQILKSKRVTLQRLDDYASTKAELMEYGISMDEVPLLRNALNNAKESGYDSVKIAKAISEMESLEQQRNNVQTTINELTKQENNAATSLEATKRELGKHQILLETFNKLHSMGFGLSQLKTLQSRIVEISEANSIKPDRAIQQLTKHLEEDYDRVVGFQKKIEGGENKVKELEQCLSSLRLEYADERYVYNSMQDLIKKDVKSEDIIAWDILFSNCNLTPPEFYENLKTHGNMALLLASKEREISELDNKIENKKQELSEIRGEIEEAKRSKSKLEGEMQYLVASTVKHLTTVKENVVKSVEEAGSKSCFIVEQVTRNLEGTGSKIDSIVEQGVDGITNVARHVTSKLTEIKDATDKQREAVMEAGRFSGLRPLIDLVNNRGVGNEELEKAILQVLKAYHSRLGFFDNTKEPLGEVISAIENRMYMLGGLNI